MGKRKSLTESMGYKVDVQIGEAKLFQIFAEKKLSDNHDLTLKIYRFSLYEGCVASSKVFPTVVQLWEKSGRQKYTDIYSFDTKGKLLNHGFSVYREDPGHPKIVIDEKHDMSVGRLRSHGATIEEMLAGVSLPSVLSMDATVNNLRTNKIEG